MTQSDNSPALVRTVGRLRRRLSRTLVVSRDALRRRDTVGVVLAVTVGYLVTFLYAIRDLSVGSGGGLSLTVADDPLVTAFQPAPGTLVYRPIALLEVGPVVWELSPLNTLLGGAVAALVGLNLALSYLALAGQRTCGVGAGAGVVAGVPALLAGSACCGPVLLLVLGIQATGALLTVFAWLLPASLLLLVLALVHVAGRVDPTAV